MSNQSTDGATKTNKVVAGEKLKGAEKVARIPIKVKQPAERLRKPSWIRAKSPFHPNVKKLKSVLRDQKLHTVCEEAACPNLGECFGKGTATFMMRIGLGHDTHRLAEGRQLDLRSEGPVPKPVGPAGPDGIQQHARDGRGYGVRGRRHARLVGRGGVPLPAWRCGRANPRRTPAVAE